MRELLDEIPGLEASYAQLETARSEPRNAAWFAGRKYLEEGAIQRVMRGTAEPAEALRKDGEEDRRRDRIRRSEPARRAAPPAKDAMLEVDGLIAPHLGPLDFSVDRGQILFVTGPSGAGKTLLLRALADLDPHEGEIRLAGAAAADIAPPEWRRRVAYLPAEPSGGGPGWLPCCPPAVDDGP